MTDVTDTPGPHDGAPEDGSDADPAHGSQTQPAPPRDLQDLPDPGGIIFDLDATLVDTLEARIRSWLGTFEEIGFEAERTHVAGLIGADGKRLAREVAEIHGRRLSEDRAEAIDRRAGERYDEINTAPEPLPGALALLRALESADLPWAIATSSRTDQVTASVRAVGLRVGSHVIDGSDVAQAKPAPDLLLHAAERIQVPSHRCWYVGDSAWDMRAARAATMIGVGVATGAATVDALRVAGAHVTIESLEPLLPELRRRGLVADPVR